jgi:probable HAF family extracellular repeat protein
MNYKRHWRMRTWLLGVMLTSASFAIAVEEPPAPTGDLRYGEVLKYGDISSGGASIVFRRLNSSNDVGGGVTRPNIQKTSKAIVLTADGIEDLAGDPSVDFSATFGLNDRGEVAGGLNTATALRPFRAKRGQNFQLLNLLPGDTAGLAFGINDGGEVAGYSSGKLGERAVWWDLGGTVKALPSPQGLTSRALGLNDKGDIVGVTGGGSQQGLLWPNKGELIKLGTLPGAGGSQAVSINERGEIVGFANHVDGIRHRARAVLWGPNGQTIQDLGALFEGGTSRARDINDRGEVVGTSVGDHEVRAFIWTAETGMVDINALVSLPSIRLTDAVGINKKGDIVVIGHEKTAAQHEHEAGQDDGEHNHADDGHEQARQIYVLTRMP